jgi:hypothetical protein
LIFDMSFGGCAADGDHHAVAVDREVESSASS